MSSKLRHERPYYPTQNLEINIENLQQVSEIIESDVEKLLESFETGNYIYVNKIHTNSLEHGTIIDPFYNIQEAINRALSGDTIIIRSGLYVVENLLLPLNKSLTFRGDSMETTFIQAGEEWTPALQTIFASEEGENYSSYVFENLTFQLSNIAINIKSAGSIIITKCSFYQNGWSGAGFDPLAIGTAETAGLGSTADELKTFAESYYLIPGGGAVICSNSSYFEMSGCIFSYNNSTVYLIDCGIPYAGDISICGFFINLRGIVFESSDNANAGCERISIRSNAIEGCASEGILQNGGANCIYAFNIVEKSWGPGLYIKNTAGTLADKNRFDDNGLNNIYFDGTAISSNATICITGDNMRNGAKFIAKVIDNIINRSIETGNENQGLELGSSLSQISINSQDSSPNIELLENSIDGQYIGLKILNGALTDEDGIKRTNLIHGRSTYAENNTINVLNLDGGPYIELPFSNIYVNDNEMNFTYDSVGHTISIKPNGNTYSVGQLKAIGLNNGLIRIVERQAHDSRIQYDNVDFNSITINGISHSEHVHEETGTEEHVVDELNALFMQTGGGNGDNSADLTLLVPTITSPMVFSVTEGESINYYITGTNFPSIFGTGTLPSGLVLNAYNGTINGTVQLYQYNDDIISLTGGEGTTLTSTAPFLVDGSNVQIAVYVGGDINTVVPLVLDINYTITDINNILLTSATYPSAISGDDVIFRIGTDNDYQFNTLCANGYGSDNQNITLSIQSGRFSEIAPPFKNTKSVRFDNRDYLQSSITAGNPLLRSGTGNGASNAWTISIWYKTSHNENNRSLFGVSTSSSKNLPYFTLEIEKTQMYMEYGTRNNRIIITIPGLSTRDGSWHHMVFIYNGLSTGGNSSLLSDYYSRFTFYIDNVKYNYADGNVTATNKGNGFNSTFTPVNFYIGSRHKTGNSFIGLVDEVSIWDHECNATHVDELYNSGHPGNLNIHSSGNPYNWWRMGENDVYPTIIDHGTGNENGRMYNMTVLNIVNDVAQ